VRRALLLLAAVAAAVLALDRWTKIWASTQLPYNQPVTVAGEFLRWTYTRNSGVAFGIGQGTGFPYYVFSLVAVAVILWMFLGGRARGTLRQVALSLILGGAVGNLWDRLRSGEVVDFIEIGFRGWHWPVFNVADSAVTVGVILFALGWSAADPEVAGDGAPAPDGAAGDATPAPGPVPGGGPEGPLA
jgi:signal peptidase II